VVHEIFGLHEYIRDVCRRLARQGYLAIAPDLYAREGDPTRAASVDAIMAEIVSRVPDAQVMADLDAAAAWSASDGGKPVLEVEPAPRGEPPAGGAPRAGGAPGSGLYATGFCWGGRVVWLYAAHRGDLVAGAAWYGRLSGPARAQTPEHPIDIADRPHQPVLGLYGGEDAGIPLEGVFAMRKKLAEAKSPSQIVVFPGAPHGFHADYRESFRPMPAEEGWRRMLEWFRQRAEEEVRRRSG
jgi:carboxymethylenebutenolidase